MDARIPSSEISIDVSTAIMRCHNMALQCRLVKQDDPNATDRLPFGPFMPDLHRTMEAGLRHWVREQVGLALGHVEQLYTFADRGRHARAAQNDPHIVSVGYLALAETGTIDAAPNQDQQLWGDVYYYFPWEDWRAGRPECLAEQIPNSLDIWLSTNPDAAERARTAFALDGGQWDEEFVLERYELLYEAGLVPEAYYDNRIAALPAPALPGLVMQLDHRRILATALGRLRGKMKYRPVIFDLMPEHFTLTDLQNTAQAVLGINLHKQNFRRLVEKSDFVEPTGRTRAARGRPAELFRLRHQQRNERPLAGLRISASRPSSGKRMR
jgi:hypothetical protein